MQKTARPVLSLLELKLSVRPILSSPLCSPAVRVPNRTDAKTPFAPVKDQGTSCSPHRYRLFAMGCFEKMQISGAFGMWHATRLIVVQG